MGLTLSNVFPLEYGISQGSPISVALFVIATADILPIQHQVNACKHVDDIVLFTSAVSLRTAQKRTRNTK